jgi:hypothetical protein
MLHGQPIIKIFIWVFFLTGAQDSHLQTVTIYQRLHIYSYDVDILKMSRVMLETCRGF